MKPGLRFWGLSQVRNPGRVPFLSLGNLKFFIARGEFRRISETFPNYFQREKERLGRPSFLLREEGFRKYRFHSLCLGFRGRGQSNIRFSEKRLRKVFPQLRKKKAALRKSTLAFLSKCVKININSDKSPIALLPHVSSGIPN